MSHRTIHYAQPSAVDGPGLKRKALWAAGAVALAAAGWFGLQALGPGGSDAPAVVASENGRPRYGADGGPLAGPAPSAAAGPGVDVEPVARIAPDTPNEELLALVKAGIFNASGGAVSVDTLNYLSAYITRNPSRAGEMVDLIVANSADPATRVLLLRELPAVGTVPAKLVGYAATAGKSADPAERLQAVQALETMWHEPDQGKAHQMTIELIRREQQPGAAVEMLSTLQKALVAPEQRREMVGELQRKMESTDADVRSAAIAAMARWQPSAALADAALAQIQPGRSDVAVQLALNTVENLPPQTLPPNLATTLHGVASSDAYSYRTRQLALELMAHHAPDAAAYAAAVRQRKALE